MSQMRTNAIKHIKYQCSITILNLCALRFVLSNSLRHLTGLTDTTFPREQHLKNYQLTKKIFEMKNKAMKKIKKLKHRT